MKLLSASSVVLLASSLGWYTLPASGLVVPGVPDTTASRAAARRVEQHENIVRPTGYAKLDRSDKPVLRYFSDVWKRAWVPPRIIGDEPSAAAAGGRAGDEASSVPAGGLIGDESSSSAPADDLVGDDPSSAPADPAPAPPPPPPPPPPIPEAAPIPIRGPAEAPATGSSRGLIAPPRDQTPPRGKPQPPGPDWKPIPEDSSPGTAPGKGNNPRPMINYENDGKFEINAYEQVIRNNLPDTVLVQSAAELAKHNPGQAFQDFRTISNYGVEDADIHISNNDWKVLQTYRSPEIGFSVKGDQIPLVKRVTVSNRVTGSTINVGAYDPDGKFIIYESAFKDAQAGLPDKLPLNELGMQAFLSAAPDGKAKNLKATFLLDIQNKEFWGITRQNYNDMKQPFTQVMTFVRGTPQFDRYMGSPNFKSKIFSFANHHNELGNKVPYKIIVAPKQVQGPGGKFSAAVIFKDFE